VFTQEAGKQSPARATAAPQTAPDQQPHESAVVVTPVFVVIIVVPVLIFAPFAQ
jgi:hypothetical protein